MCIILKKRNETVDMDRNSLYTELEAVFAKALSTSEMKYRALNIIMETVNNHEAGKVKVKDSTLSGYRKERIIRELCETMLIISILLFEPMDAVNYYWKHDKESNREVTLYRILDTVSSFGDDKLWIEVYEDGLKRKIKPRESLVNTYNELKNKFTES